jgi:NADPH2:quinone reductase
VRAANLALLAPHGRLAIYGNIASFGPVEVPVLAYSSSLLARTHPARPAASARHVLDEAASGRVRVGIGVEFPLDGAGSAMAALAAGTAAPGKVLLRVS